jgi:superfamily I DNA/RNA helicase
MKESWWKKQTDLDDTQQNVVGLEPDGRYLLLGPPGSGKTNLLLLRAMFLSSSGLKDVLFLTVGRTLQEFIATGVGTKGLLDTKSIQTFRGWTMRHLGEHSPQFMKSRPTGDYDTTRAMYVDQLLKVNKKLPKLYQAILVDEVQDFSEQELEAVALLSNRIMVAGDGRQQIFQGGEGIEAAKKMGLKEINLEYHYRIGRKICEVADSVLPPSGSQKPLLKTCNYDEKALPSTVQLIPAKSQQEQLQLALENIKVQLRAFPDDSIGVFLPRNDSFPAARAFFDASDIAGLVEYHEHDGSRQFPPGKRIFCTTIHSAKGTEFRAVHILFAEQLVPPLATRKVLFTAITRAKTSLMTYHTGAILPYIHGAFSAKSTPKLSELFS